MWWHSREYQEYLRECERRRLQHRKEAEELMKRKVLTEKQIREKLIDLRETLDSFKGQRVPNTIIPTMRALHEALVGNGYYRSRKKPFWKRLFRR